MAVMSGIVPLRGRRRPLVRHRRSRSCWPTPSPAARQKLLEYSDTAYFLLLGDRRASSPTRTCGTGCACGRTSSRTSPWSAIAVGSIAMRQPVHAALRPGAGVARDLDAPRASSAPTTSSRARGRRPSSSPPISGFYGDAVLDDSDNLWTALDHPHGGDALRGPVHPLVPARGRAPRPRRRPGRPTEPPPPPARCSPAWSPTCPSPGSWCSRSTPGPWWVGVGPDRRRAGDRRPPRARPAGRRRRPAPSPQVGRISVRWGSMNSRIRDFLANPLSGLAPWIVMAVMSGIVRFELAVGLSLLTAVVIVVANTAHRRHPEAPRVLRRRLLPGARDRRPAGQRRRHGLAAHLVRRALQHRPRGDRRSGRSSSAAPSPSATRRSQRRRSSGTARPSCAPTTSSPGRGRSRSSSRRSAASSATP